MLRVVDLFEFQPQARSRQVFGQVDHVTWHIAAVDAGIPIWVTAAGRVFPGLRSVWQHSSRGADCAAITAALTTAPLLHSKQFHYAVGFLAPEFQTTHAQYPQRSRQCTHPRAWRRRADDYGDHTGVVG